MILMVESEGKRPPGRARFRCLDNIKMDLRAIGWIDLTGDKEEWKGLVNTVMNLWVP
jgi:hypothetical protein